MERVNQTDRRIRMNTDYKLPEKGTKEYLRRKEKFKKVQERKKKAKKKDDKGGFFFFFWF